MVQPDPVRYKGGASVPPLLIQEHYMARRNISSRRHGKKFARARRRTRAINTPSHVMRGGIRL